VIRRALGIDHSWIARLAAEVYVELGDYGAIIPSWLEHPGVLAYIDEAEATGGGKVRRGFILLGFYQPGENVNGEYVADLLAIAVEPAYQRQGVGRRLLEYSIHLSELASRTNCVPEIRLTVADTNGVGRKLFASAGFAVLDENHGAYDGGQRAIRMTRRLMQQQVRPVATIAAREASNARNTRNIRSGG
jgi:GNAT superfamily N-acetyltransferase